MKTPSKTGSIRRSSAQPTGSKAAARPAPKTETEVTADIVQLALRSRFNPIRGLTPQILSSQLDNFMLGFVAFAALTWDSIERRDDVLKGVAAKRKKAVAKLKRESLQRDDTPQAELHAEALDEFYDNLTAVNALDENERGGISLLVRQMADAIGKYYAVHELVWQPGDILTAECRFTPLWFFENRTGKLQFLRIPLGGANGEPLEEGGWMITKGDGLMEACCIAYMFKNMPLKDWVSYSDKYGTPGVLGRTNAAKGSDAGNAMRDAVAAFGQNWSGVTYGDDGAIKEPLSLITAAGEGSLPFPPLVERMDRAMSALWRGSDLSTMSADNKGASVQGDEGDILLEDDAAMISDTLNLYIDRWVIWQKFGTRTPLAYSKLIVPERQNVELDLKIDDMLLKSGARLGERATLERYGRPVIEATDTPLHNPATVTERVQDTTTGNPPPTGDLPNAQQLEQLANERAKAVDKLLAASMQSIGAAVASDLKPIATRLNALLEMNETNFANELAALVRDLPALATKAISNPETARAFEQSLTAALFNGLTDKK